GVDDFDAIGQQRTAGQLSVLVDPHDDAEVGLVPVYAGVGGAAGADAGGRFDDVGFRRGDAVEPGDHRPLPMRHLVPRYRGARRRVTRQGAGIEVAVGGVDVRQHVDVHRAFTQVLALAPPVDRLAGRDLHRAHAGGRAVLDVERPDGAVQIEVAVGVH